MIPSSVADAYAVANADFRKVVKTEDRKYSANVPHVGALAAFARRG